MIARAGIRRPVLRLFALWMLPALLFTAVYYFGFHASLFGSLNHLTLVASTTLLLLGVLLASGARYVWIERVGLALTLSWTIFWSAIYALMIVGLMSWGRIPTVGLVAAYADQVPSLLRVVNVAPMVAAGGVVLAAVSVLFATWAAARGSWRVLATALPALARDAARPAWWRNLLIAIAAVLLVAVTRWYAVVERTEAASDEPVHLALGVASSHDTQTLIMNRIGDGRRVQIESGSRERYRAQLAATPVPASPTRNVVLITVDALRPDHLGINGYARDTTPRLAALQTQGLLWTAPEARSACAESACGLLSLTSGKQPHELLTRNFGLIEVLGLHGYQRTLLMSGDHTNFYRLRESYGDVETYIDGTSFPPDRINDDYALLERLSQLPAAEPGRPQFMFFHLMSAHGLGSKHPEHRLWLPAKTLYGTFSAPVTDESMALGRNSYDHGVRQADWVIGEIVAELTRRGVLNDASLLLLTADHGESIGEHGIKTHVESVYDSVIRIPWIWIGARPPYAQLATPAVQADFAPTVLTALGLPVPSHWSGIPLQTAPSARRSFHAQPPFAAVVDYDGRARRKLVRDFRQRKAQVFDLAIDPRELSAADFDPAHSAQRDALDALIRNGYGDGMKQ